MHEDYLPQDNGNHTGTRWLKLTDCDGAGWMIFRQDKYFTFNIHHYTQKLLQKAAHREDLYDEHTTAVTIRRIYARRRQQQLRSGAMEKLHHLRKRKLGV